jgi:dsDNA-binding SOS-regulon protein
MAVEVKYVVIRKVRKKCRLPAKRKPMLTTKCWIQQRCSNWLEQSPVALEDEQREALSLWLAEQKDVLSAILKNGKAFAAGCRKRCARWG